MEQGTVGVGSGVLVVGSGVNAMPILNYTTTISADKTVAEIQGCLAQMGVKSIQVQYVDGQPDALYFTILVKQMEVSFRLPSRWQGVYASLRAEAVARRYKTEEQARRVAWRITKDWVAAQMAIIEAGAADVEEVFLPYLLNLNNGKTLYEEFQAHDHLLLSPHGGE